MSKCPQLKPKSRPKKGFTLLEILVAISLSTLLLGALYGVYITSYKSYKNSIGKAELNQNARIAMERITRDFRQTPDIVTVLPPSDTDLLNPPSSEIQFQDGHDTANIKYIRYYLSNNELRREVSHYSLSSDAETWVAWNVFDQYGDHSQTIEPYTIKADKVTSIKFYGTNPINIEIVVSGQNGSYTYKTQTLGRNVQ
jgi:prepilin-type N-terminal cleavage/methylation domain-containing protein